MTTTTIAWLRNDLRLSDNPALDAAMRAGDSVIALYIHEESKDVRPPGAAGEWWLHHSLMALGKDLAEHGVVLEVRRGDSADELQSVIGAAKATAVFWNRRYAPGERAVDAAIKSRLGEAGIEVHSFAANVLVEPWEIETGQGKPYSVYTPFWRALKARAIAQPLRRPTRHDVVQAGNFDADYREPHWAGKLGQYWTIGEAGAHSALDRFLDQQLSDYADDRDFPATEATSRLSPHLRWGEISPRQIWHAAQAVAHGDHHRQQAVDKFLSELAWRDFNYHQLYHRENIATQVMRPKYQSLQWRTAPDDLAAWQRGQTGLPIVDAGMRELWETGYMQNRVRLLVASLLSKNLLIDWRLGEQWFWDCLVDGDIANNPGNWQWVAGSGLDASPYFRIFNPVTQGERYDAAGAYVRHWVPELAQMPDEWVHRPAEAPVEVLKTAGVEIGVTYPAPISDLKASRQRALDAAASL